MDVENRLAYLSLKIMDEEENSTTKTSELYNCLPGVIVKTILHMSGNAR